MPRLVSKVTPPSADMGNEMSTVPGVPLRLSIATLLEVETTKKIEGENKVDRKD